VLWVAAHVPVTDGMCCGSPRMYPRACTLGSPRPSHPPGHVSGNASRARMSMNPVTGCISGNASQGRGCRGGGGGGGGWGGGRPKAALGATKPPRPRRPPPPPPPPPPPGEPKRRGALYKTSAARPALWSAPPSPYSATRCTRPGRVPGRYPSLRASVPGPSSEWITSGLLEEGRSPGDVVDYSHFLSPGPLPGTDTSNPLVLLAPN
jgi:hypothetical protein